jgi:hypothetical protein
MKKLVLAFVITATIGGCTTLKNIGTAISVGTASITNPVTKTRLNQMESAMIVVFAGLDAWRDSCEKGLIPSNCVQQINSVQVYTRQWLPYRDKLRAFVKSGDQVNAIKVFNTVVDLANTIKEQAAAGGVTITANVGS